MNELFSWPRGFSAAAGVSAADDDRRVGWFVLFEVGPGMPVPQLPPLHLPAVDWSFRARSLAAAVQSFKQPRWGRPRPSSAVRRDSCRFARRRLRRRYSTSSAAAAFEVGAGRLRSEAGFGIAF